MPCRFICAGVGVAISDNLFTNVGQPSNSDPQMVIHGLFAAAWVALFAAQAWLINLRRISAHRRVGRIGFVAGVGMALSTVYLFYSKFRGFAAMDGEVLANRLLLPVFVVCFVLAWRRRNRADWHKRLLLVGTMALLEPVLARIYDPLFGWLLPVRMDPALDMALFLAGCIHPLAATIAGSAASMPPVSAPNAGRISRGEDRAPSPRRAARCARRPRADDGEARVEVAGQFGPGLARRALWRSTSPAQLQSRSARVPPAAVAARHRGCR
jgi:hypothetical protein